MQTAGQIGRRQNRGDSGRIYAENRALVAPRAAAGYFAGSGV